MRHGGLGRPERLRQTILNFSALTLSAPLYATVAALARASFQNDTAAAAGWLLARGSELRLALPTVERVASAAVPRAPRRVQSAPARVLRSDPDPSSARAIVSRRLPRRSSPAAKRSAQIAVDAPDGAELRDRRERIVVSQKEVAAAVGLPRSSF